MTEIKCIGFGHMVVSGFYSRANTRLVPTFVLGKRVAEKK